jgi:hypothetical protein
LGRLVDASEEAWYIIDQASNELGKHLQHTPLESRCRKWDLRRATQDETKLLRKANVVLHGRAPLLASPDNFQEALWKLGLSLEPPRRVHEEVRPPWDCRHVSVCVWCLHVHVVA